MRATMKATGRFTDFNIAPDSGESPTLDSIGEGDIVASYKTVDFREHSTKRMTVNMLGEPSTWTVVQTTYYYVAPGFPSDSLDPRSASGSTKALTPKYGVDNPLRRKCTLLH